jgi:hypothetical protein
MSFNQQDLQALDAFTSGDTEAIDRLAAASEAEQREYNAKMNAKWSQVQMTLVTEVIAKLNPTHFFDPDKPLRDQDPGPWMVATLKLVMDAANKGVKFVGDEVSRLAIEATLEGTDGD